jgi:uncharacterized membrane protein YgcG
MKDLLFQWSGKGAKPPVPMASDKELTLVKDRSFAYLHWGTLALFVVAYAGIPLVWDTPGMAPLFVPVTAAGFYVSWRRIGKQRTNTEGKLLGASCSMLVMIAILVYAGLYGSVSSLGADLVAAVCAGFSFSLKRARDYFFIMAASAAILIVGLFSRDSLSLVPVLLYLCLLIPVVQQGRREHHVRAVKVSAYSVEEQGKKAPFMSGLLLPALILMLAATLLYLVLPKPLREPPDIFRKVSTQQGQGSPADLGEELPHPLNGGGSAVGEGTGSGGGGTGGEGSGAGKSGQTGRDTGGGSMGSLLFEVECAEACPLRLKAFDHLDNGVWKSSTEGFLYQPDGPRIEVIQVQEELDGKSMAGFVASDLVFFVRAPLGREMPAGMNPITVYLDKEPADYSLYIDVNDNLYTAEDMEAGYTYAMTSMLPLDAVPEDGAIPSGIEDRYAGGYDGVGGLAEMARQATVGRVTQAEKVEGLIDYINESFIYDPAVTMEPGGANLDRYINGDHHGDIELTATAMTLLCRELGIPARPVLGFLPRIFNGETGRFEVYTQDVYYWVEVYFSNCGWLSCLPVANTSLEECQQEFNFGVELEAGAGTGSQQGEAGSGGESGTGTGGGEGSGGGSTGTGGGESGESSARPGTGETQVDRSMERFEPGGQSPGDAAPSSFSEKDESRASKVMLLFLLAILVLLLLFLGGIALWSWWKKRRRRNREAEEEVARGVSLSKEQGRFIYLTYKKMCEELAGIGLSRQKSETPEEFLVRIRSTYPSATQYAAPISGALEDTLYGMHPIDQESLRKLDVCLQYLRELCQGIKSSAGKEWR